MKKLLAVVIGLVLAVGVSAVAALVPYGAGYLAMGRISPETMGVTPPIYWVTGVFLIVTALVCLSLWKVAYEEVCRWFGW